VEKLQASQVHSTLSRVLLADGFDMVYDLDKSHGMRLHDKVTGKEYLDFFSFFGSWPLSHNHPKILNDKNFLDSIAKVKLFTNDLYNLISINCEHLCLLVTERKSNLFGIIISVTGGTPQPCEQ
jgi:4-aminobutyrate aminotransferase-like enzyme